MKVRKMHGFVGMPLRGAHKRKDKLSRAQLKLQLKKEVY